MGWQTYSRSKKETHKNDPRPARPPPNQKKDTPPKNCNDCPSYPKPKIAQAFLNKLGCDPPPPEPPPQKNPSLTNFETPSAKVKTNLPTPLPQNALSPPPPPRLHHNLEYIAMPILYLSKEICVGGVPRKHSSWDSWLQSSHMMTTL